MIDRDVLPEDPDLDDVPSDLKLLAGIDAGIVVVLSEDGVSRDALAIAPGLFGHARRLRESSED